MSDVPKVEAAGAKDMDPELKAILKSAQALNDRESVLQRYVELARRENLISPQGIKSISKKPFNVKVLPHSCSSDITDDGDEAIKNDESDRNETDAGKEENLDEGGVFLEAEDIGPGSTNTAPTAPYYGEIDRGDFDDQNALRKLEEQLAEIDNIKKTGPHDWRNNTEFDKPSEDIMLVRFSHSRIPPYGDGPSVCMLGAHPCAQYESTMEGVGRFGANAASISLSLPYLSSENRTPGISFKAHYDLHLNEPAHKDRLTFAYMKKYQPFLACSTVEHFNDPKYKRDKIKRILDAHDKLRNKENYSLKEKIMQERNVVLARIHGSAPPIVRPKKNKESKEKKKDRALPSAGKVARAALVAGAEPPPPNQRKYVRTLQEHLDAKKDAVRSTFPVNPDYKLAGQKLVAFTIFDDLENADDPKNAEPVVIWFRTFSEDKDFDDWMAAGARDALQYYDVDLVPLYEWLGLRLTKEEKQAIPTKRGSKEADLIFEQRAKETELVKRYERYCSTKGRPMSYTEMTPDGPREFMKHADGTVVETPMTSVEDALKPPPTPTIDVRAEDFLPPHRTTTLKK